MSGVTTSAHLCTTVYDGDLQLLRRLILAGANPDAMDYDGRTALHIAAADGNLPAVRGPISFAGKKSDMHEIPQPPLLSCQLA